MEARTKNMMFVQNQRVAALINATLSLCLRDAIYHSHLRNMEMKLCLLKVSCTFSLFSFQEMYKASKYEVSPDMKLVLLAYNVQPVRPVFIWVLYVCVEMKVIMSPCERAATLHRLTRTKYTLLE